MSDYPTALTDGLSVRGIPLFQAHPGKVFWVNNSTVLAKGGVGGNNANPGTYQKPFATIDYAIGRCTASRGDIIFVMPGYAETIAVAANAITCDVAGVAIIGLGTGTLRPTITLTSNAFGSMPISAANVTWKNFIFSAGVADLNDVFILTTATYFTVEDCSFQDAAAGQNFLDIVDTDTGDNDADNLAIINCDWISPDTGCQSFVNVDADLDGLTIHDCYVDLGVNGVLSIFAEVAAGKDLTNVDIRRNYGSRLVTASAVGYITFADTTTTNTGIMEDNTWRSLDTAGELYVTAGTNISFNNNKATSVIDKSGYLLPAADS